MLVAAGATCREKEKLMTGGDGGAIVNKTKNRER